MATSLLRKTCKFCGSEIYPGTGWMYVKADGTIWYFCSSKCAKNALKLRRSPEKLKWTRRSLKERRSGG